MRTFRLRVALALAACGLANPAIAQPITPTAKLLSATDLLASALIPTGGSLLITSAYGALMPASMLPNHVGSNIVILPTHRAEAILSPVAGDRALPVVPGQAMATSSHPQDHFDHGPWRGMMPSHYW